MYKLQHTNFRLFREGKEGKISVQTPLNQARTVDRRSLSEPDVAEE
ncbi:MAG TPA: hypothetical protein V6D18_05310 [Thermosynechococcaceae cyanobacterium]